MTAQRPVADAGRLAGGTSLGNAWPLGTLDFLPVRSAGLLKGES